MFSSQVVSQICGQNSLEVAITHLKLAELFVRSDELVQCADMLVKAKVGNRGRDRDADANPHIGGTAQRD